MPIRKSLEKYESSFLTNAYLCQNGGGRTNKDDLPHEDMELKFSKLHFVFQNENFKTICGTDI